MVVHEQSKQISDLIKYILQAMVDNPEQVEISEIDGTQTTVLEVRVAKSDMGKVIGKKGRNINAIRTILTCASANANKLAILELVEE
jgi:predicted RNA-binding protein YlqC (UPF0109 family)